MKCKIAGTPKVKIIAILFIFSSCKLNVLGYWWAHPLILEMWQYIMTEFKFSTSDADDWTIQVERFASFYS